MEQLVRLDETEKPVHGTRSLVERSRKLHRVFEQNLAIYKDAHATTRRVHKRMIQRWPAIQGHASRRRARWQHLLISIRIDEGRLPDAVSRTALVSGFGGECEACDVHMPSTQLVKAIPKGETFVYLHSDCYGIWEAQCRLHTALSRIV